ncbi:Type I restriction-modification system, specificity subunit S [uncultured Gammaproteobacteria bacterium]|jgi:type I restriction enzyme S subunit|nr:Type I restriction-modification system, specificity subunit S [uncultured Gammaproteobacteria bacterium]CAC9965493.1 Type I restriction-modification system, specificity subunit S [uncultured Gammaproteobacteria bacterium]
MKMDKNLHIPQGYRQTEVGVIPDDWEVVRLSQIGNVIGGGTPDTENGEYWNDDIYWFTPTEIKQKYINKSVRKISKKGLQKSSAKILSKNTLLLTTRATIGDIGIALNECSTNQGFQSIFVNEKNSYMYIYYWILNNRNELIKRSSGSTFLEISKREIEKIQLIRPPKQEQQKIADILTTWDNAINQQTTLIEKKQQLKKGLMQQIFSQRVRFKDRNGNNFLDWQDEKLGDMCDIAKSGGTPKSTAKEYYDGNIPFLAISDMTKQGKYLTQTSKKISQLGIEHSASWIVPLNTIIYSMYASVGFVSINKIPLATSQAVINLILKNGYLVEFIYYHLVELKNLIHKFIETGAQGNLNAETVKSLILNIPPIKEQQKIAQVLTLADNEITKLQTELALLKTQKKGLMQQLLTGKTRVKF